MQCVGVVCEYVCVCIIFRKSACKRECVRAKFTGCVCLYIHTDICIYIYGCVCVCVFVCVRL